MTTTTTTYTTTTTTLCQETTLADLQKALSQSHQDVLIKNQELLVSVAESVKEYMSQYDLSHDFNHILRVLTLSRRILDVECQDGGIEYDPIIVFLSALLHDIGDHKYIKTGESATAQIATILSKAGASPSLTQKVRTIASNISYTTEIKDPARLQGILQHHRELGIVQDADRLDAIGATGIGRAFAFGGAKKPDLGLENPREHLSEKLEGLVDFMKTGTGKRMAVERTKRLRIFQEWWDEEMRFES
ncbi:hypothetical protein SI65_07038 [Aspergillus cristatus]|uniref:HD/PDEase domain-containing protein n=1 Tax=Aspergillus cristatus TaxID=573508 RepID=A0A1E3B8R2_ASPCR|nr:hypothetical protein SI65_07038 [Aspergillus cristatus]